MENASPPQYIAMGRHTRLARYLALVSYLGLLSWVAIWQSWLSPHPHLAALPVTLAWLFPLLLPLVGILKAKPYTHAWANFMLMLYFLHGLTILYLDGGERWLAAVELALTSLGFVGNILFARMRGQELGQKLPRLSQVEKEESARFTASKQ